MEEQHSECASIQTSYLISVGVACVQDEEEVECAGYNVDQYTAVIRAVRMVERNAFKCPPLLEFHGPLASKKFLALMTKYCNLYYDCKHDKIRAMVSKIISNDRIELDI